MDDQNKRNAYTILAGNSEEKRA